MTVIPPYFPYTHQRIYPPTPTPIVHAPLVETRLSRHEPCRPNTAALMGCYFSFSVYSLGFRGILSEIYNKEP